MGRDPPPGKAWRSREGDGAMSWESSFSFQNSGGKEVYGKRKGLAVS